MLIALKRILPLIAILLILAACGSGDRDQPTGAIPADTPASPAPFRPAPSIRARNRMSDSMLAQIVGYYNKVYGNAAST
jgi:hypothetical protein